MPQIYVIYRSEDTRKKSKEIISILEKTYGASNIQSPDYEGYIDVYAIEDHVQKSDFLLVIIGNYWADMVDESGVNLLNSVYDPVHMAIATALNSRKQVIPILVDGASMPHRTRLPRELRKLTAQEPLKLDKHDALAKSLTKGLKDIIKHDNRLKVPDFVSQVKLPKRIPTPARQPTPPRNRQYWVKRALIASAIIIIVAIIMILLIMPVTVESSIVSTTNIVTDTPVRATVAPTSTMTQNVPSTAIPLPQKITAINASQLILIEDNPVSRAPIDLVIFSQDQMLFIFVSPEQQAVHVKEIATDNILKIISTAPHDPIAIQLTADETRLLILLRSGDVVAWGVPME